MKASMGKAKVALLCAFGILVFTLWINVGAHAQNTSTAGNSTTTTSSQQHVPKIKITSPTRGQQLTVGKDLTVSGNL